MELMEQYPAAWQEGFDAGLALGTLPCPYPAGTNEAWSWQSGFVEARHGRSSEH
jgi:hypothetical protein